MCHIKCILHPHSDFVEQPALISTVLAVADPGFPRWGWAPTLKFGAKTYYLQDFAKKTTWNWKIGEGSMCMISIVFLLVYHLNSGFKMFNVWKTATIEPILKLLNINTLRI